MLEGNSLISRVNNGNKVTSLQTYLYQNTDAFRLYGIYLPFTATSADFTQGVLEQAIILILHGSMIIAIIIDYVFHTNVSFTSPSAVNGL